MAENDTLLVYTKNDDVEIDGIHPGGSQTIWLALVVKQEGEEGRRVIFDPMEHVFLSFLEIVVTCSACSARHFVMPFQHEQNLWDMFPSQSCKQRSRVACSKDC